MFPTTRPIPRAGVRRRRAKAIARRRHVHAQENDRRVAAGRLPAHWVALDSCPCGLVAWLEEGATAADREAFDQAAADHASMCTYLDEGVPA